MMGSGERGVVVEPHGVWEWLVSLRSVCRASGFEIWIIYSIRDIHCSIKEVGMKLGDFIWTVNSHTKSEKVDERLI